jgi:hypothetical protein
LKFPNEIGAEIFIHFLSVYPACPPLTGNFSPFLSDPNLPEMARNNTRYSHALATGLTGTNIILRPKPYGRATNQYKGYVASFPAFNPDFWSFPVGAEALVSHHARWEYLELYLAICPLPVAMPAMPLLRSPDPQGIP